MIYDFLLASYNLRQNLDNIVGYVKITLLIDSILKILHAWGDRVLPTKPSTIFSYFCDSTQTEQSSPLLLPYEIQFATTNFWHRLIPDFLLF